MQATAAADTTPPDTKSSPSFQLYHAYTMALAEQVRRGQIGDAEASFRLTTLAHRIQAERQARSDIAYQNLLRYTEQMERARRPQSGNSISCRTMWGMTNCTTY